MRRFSLYLRGKIYYAKFFDPKTKKFTSGLSTGETRKNEALAAVYSWEKHGREIVRGRPATTPEGLLTYSQIIGALEAGNLTAQQMRNIATKAGEILETMEPTSPGFIEFLKEFWDFENSPYIRERLSYGHKFGEGWSKTMGARVKYWEDFLGPEAAARTRLKDITADKIREFQQWVSGQGIAPRTQNGATDCAAVALKWAAEREKIPADPTKGLRKFAPNYKRRGILDPAEARGIFLVPWRDERARVANLLAATTGLRAGEILALKLENVGLDRISVNFSWNTIEKRKSTKTGECREVPILESVRAELLALAKKNPHKDGYIFYGVKPDEPANKESLLKNLRTAFIEFTWPRIAKEQDQEELKARELAREEFTARALAFHGWRHFYVSNIASATDQRTVQQIAGHKSAAMSEHYANHALETNFQKASRAVSEVFEGTFGEVVDFPKEARG